MSYASVDALQKILAEGVFHHTTDKKKASGRALGTIVELITYYMLRQWNLTPYVSIELRLPEFGNLEITHNVEFGIHPMIQLYKFCNINIEKLPISPAFLCKMIPMIKDLYDKRGFTKLNNQVLSSKLIQRNACTIGKKIIDEEKIEQFVVANLGVFKDSKADLLVSILHINPFAIVECKRVGVEEGARKGPTTIEKAKQGAYVAKHVSSLQKIRSADGMLFGALAKPKGGFVLKPWDSALEEMIYKAPVEDLRDFVLTVGIASNHGNWFTSNNPNKELLVLKQSYDWLLFLSDIGLAEFVTDLILNSDNNDNPVKKSFLASYDSPGSGNNQFTKVKIHREAHLELEDYFSKNIGRIEQKWFNLLSPAGKDIAKLKEQLKTLSDKEWFK